MSTIKLNDTNRARIINSLLAVRFDSALDDINQKKLALGVDVYNTKYSQTTRAAMMALPDGWLPTINTIRARLGGIDFGVTLPDKATRLRVPKSDYNSSGLSTFLLNELNGMLADRWSIISRDAKDLDTQRASLRQQIKEVVHSVTTVNKLGIVWPEAKPVLEQLFPNGTEVLRTNLPAIILKDLTRALGLKKVA